MNSESWLIFPSQGDLAGGLYPPSGGRRLSVIETDMRDWHKELSTSTIQFDAFQEVFWISLRPPAHR